MAHETISLTPLASSMQILSPHIHPSIQSNQEVKENFFSITHTSASGLKVHLHLYRCVLSKNIQISHKASDTTGDKAEERRRSPFAISTQLQGLGDSTVMGGGEGINGELSSVSKRVHEMTEHI